MVFGPQDDYFSEEAKKVFTTSEYVISSESDRMGFRLDGPKVEHLEGADIISDGIVFGSVQIPGHGNPIVMMADRQTTGGYTKIATVISADLPKVAQMGPGSKIKFEALSIEEAQDLFAENEKTFEEIKESIIKTKFNFIDSKPMDKTIVQSVPYTLGRTKKFKVVEDVKKYAHSKNYDTCEIDGVRVNFDYGWALVRASNTGPNVTMRFEADKNTLLQDIQKEFTKVVEDASGVKIDLPINEVKKAVKKAITKKTTEKKTSAKKTTPKKTITKKTTTKKTTK